MIHPKQIRKQRLTLLFLIISVFVTAFIATGLGYSSVSFDRILPTFMGGGTFKESFVIFSVRLPRIAITVLAGMALALSGAILQSITQNDLADPGIIGINAGAGLGIAVYFLYFPLQVGTFVYMIPLVGFIGAIVTSALIYLFSYQKNVGFQPVRLVLVGIGFAMALSGAMIILISSAERKKVDFIANWLAGNIWGTDFSFVLAILPWLLVLIPYTIYKASRMNLLSLSEPVAIGAGVSIEKERVTLLITAVALAAASVSVTGGIAFIGLLAPHLAKALVGKRAEAYIPVSILLGGLLLLIADTIGRNVLDPEGIPAGIMTALIGAPYFIYLLIKKT
ncbi:MULTISPECIES: FecCD family ABC transporter permease [Pontibacillus]|uniref:Iron ABC transporter permease n=1 Tax=Pontibacillus chungwhensis TaxID=265426 RepID=A0ABY8V4U0_9BACI|nr:MULTISPECIES: iron ABC transporter permease [Pontibacillus]MCD5322319.1 iron ABC transporter permease [Pontibacillus sp. HN14]WIF99610.1 iron ABC transporter permease [Pontibacillus chungwhensis]